MCKDIEVKIIEQHSKTPNFQASETFENEASLLQDRLESLLYAWKPTGIRLVHIKVKVFWIVDKKVSI
jgi:hypothetical protein